MINPIYEAMAFRACWALAEPWLYDSDFLEALSSSDI